MTTAPEHILFSHHFRLVIGKALALQLIDVATFVCYGHYDRSISALQEACAER